jgi:hypothetical protein
MSDKDSITNRIYKLSNNEKASAADLEKLIAERCHYVKHVAVNTDDKEHPVALIFPDKNLMAHPDYEVTPEEGCFCPRSLDELGRCLTGCLNLVNHQLYDLTSGIKEAVIVNEEPAGTGKQVTSSDLFTKYKKLLHEKHGDHVPAKDEIYYIKNL